MAAAQARDRGGSAPSAALAWLSLALAPLVLRAIALADAGARPVWADGRGALADIAVAGICVSLLWWPARRARVFALLAVLVLTGVAYANYEIVRALRAVASFSDIAFLGDATFLAGSATALSRPLLFLMLLVASGVASWRWLALPRASFGLAVGGLGIATLWGSASLGEDARVASWRQVNVFAQNADWLFHGNAAADPVAGQLAARHPGLLADLAGESILSEAHDAPNVLLVVLEGVSGAELASAALEHGRHAERPMPRLDAIFATNVGYSTFVNHNRRTDRGLYTLLCGELPNLGQGLAKMTVGSRRLDRHCLPLRLRERGYTTAYLQAAPLAFMAKDQFMPRAGFSIVRGAESFERFNLRSFWGVDDHAFFDGARSLVRDLRAASEPWFLTLLTVGTHHPYVVPEGRGEGAGAAFAQLDAAIGDFVAWLDADGVRDDTLILITSDESAGLWPGTPDGVAVELTQNWGFLAALLPSRTRARVKTPSAQLDVALSVLDYLGLDDATDGLHGRSLFRRYSTGRHVFFGNVNLRTLSVLAPDGYLMHCRDGVDSCAGYDAFSGDMFARSLRAVPSRPELEVLLRDVAAVSRPSAVEPELTVPLVAEPRVVVEGRDWQLVHGTPLTLAAGEWLEVEIEVRATGQGVVEFEHLLRFPRRRDALRAPMRIAAGESTALRYTLAPGSPIARITCQSQARLVEGRRVELELRARRLAIHRAGEAPPPGLRVVRYVGRPATAARALEVLPPDEIDRIGRGMSGASGEAP